MPVDAGLTVAAGNYAPSNDLWMASPPHFPTMVNVAIAPEDASTLYSPVTPYDVTERAYALQEYGLGLDTRVGETLAMGEDPVAGLDGNGYF